MKKVLFQSLPQQHRRKYCRTYQPAKKSLSSVSRKIFIIDVVGFKKDISFHVPIKGACHIAHQMVIILIRVAAFFEIFFNSLLAAMEIILIPDGLDTKYVKLATIRYFCGHKTALKNQIFDKVSSVLAYFSINGFKGSIQEIPFCLGIELKRIKVGKIQKVL